MIKTLPYIAAHHDQLDDLVVDLPRDTLDPVADFFKGIAKVVADYATLHEMQKDREAASARRLGELRGLGAVVAIMISQGRTFEEVAQALEAQGTPRETTLAYWHRHRKAQERLSRARRNRDILRMASLGWTDKRIGASVGLHAKSVSRIVQKELRRAAGGR